MLLTFRQSLCKFPAGQEFRQISLPSIGTGPTEVTFPLFGFHVHGTPQPLQWIGQPRTHMQALNPGPSEFVDGKNDAYLLPLIVHNPSRIKLGILKMLSFGVRRPLFRDPIKGLTVYMLFYLLEKLM